MRNLLLIMLVGVVVGVVGCGEKPKPQIQTIRENLPKLKVGMSPDEVYTTLGVDLRDRLAPAGGPEHRIWTRYQLRKDYEFLITFDYSDIDNPKFVEAKLVQKIKVEPPDHGAGN